MIDLDVFMPSILPYAPGCPEPTAFTAIIQAAQAFCERTRLWRDRDQFNVTPTSCNAVCAPNGAELFEIESARFNGCDLEPISLADLDTKHPTWRQMSAGEARWITQTEPGSVLLVPTCTGTLDLSTILRPADNAEQLPDLFSQYTQVIADGALGDILMLPAQSFSDPSRAQFYSMRFDNRIDELFNRTIQGQQRAPVRTRARFF
jgi:hypothetical protein